MDRRISRAGRFLAPCCLALATGCGTASPDATSLAGAPAARTSDIEQVALAVVPGGVELAPIGVSQVVPTVYPHEPRAGSEALSFPHFPADAQATSPPSAWNFQPSQTAAPADAIPPSPADVAPSQPAADPTILPGMTSVMRTPANPSNATNLDGELSSGHTALPWIAEAINNPEMQALERRVRQQIEHGISLAERGATHSARADFRQALQTVAQAIDAYTATDAHSRALAAGFRAMDEARDFEPRAGELTAELDLKIIVSGHLTPVIKDASEPGLTPLIAQQRYYTYAQEQLSVAVGQQVVAGRALYSLGKLETLRGNGSGEGWTSNTARAVVYYQAALAVDSRNALTANELGVLLARYGRFEEAKMALLHAAMSQPHPAAWRNLASVHGRLGESEMAGRAAKESELASQALAPDQSVLAGNNPPVTWVDPQSFARSSTSGVWAVEQAPAATTAAKPAAKPPAEKKSTSWFPWSKTQHK